VSTNFVASHPQPARVQSARALPRGTRRLVLGAETFYYAVSRGSVTLLLASSRQGIAYDKWVLTLAEVTGRSWNVLERGQWKKTSDGALTPGDLRRFLERWDRVTLPAIPS